MHRDSVAPSLCLFSDQSRWGSLWTNVMMYVTAGVKGKNIRAGGVCGRLKRSKTAAFRG